MHVTLVYSGFCGWSFSYSAMLGSIVALGDDFLELFVFSAMLGSTLDTCCCQFTWPFHRCSSWTRLFVLIQEVHHSGGAAVAVPLQGRQHPRRFAETVYHGLTCQRPLRFSCCSTMTRWMMFVVLVVQVLMGAVVEETVEFPRLHSLRNLSRGAAHQRVDELMG